MPLEPRFPSSHLHLEVIVKLDLAEVSNAFFNDANLAREALFYLLCKNTDNVRFDSVASADRNPIRLEHQYKNCRRSLLCRLSDPY